jgi:hypothetical protein
MNDSKNIKTNPKSWFLIAAIFLFTFFIFLMAPVVQLAINQSIIVYTLRIKSLLPSLYKREEFPSLEKRG